MGEPVSGGWRLPTEDIFASASDPKDGAGGATPGTSSMTFGSAWARTTTDAGIAGTELAVPIGRDDDGEVDLIDMFNDSLVLVSGALHSGKTALLRSILVGVLMRASPDRLRLLLIDTGGDSFEDLAGIPHLLAPRLVDPREALAALDGVVAEVGQRYAAMASSGVRSIDRLAESEQPPRILVVIDELLPLQRTDEAGLERTAVNLADRGRAAGVHSLIAASSRSGPVISAISSNITEEMSFDTAFASGSRVPDSVLINGQLPRGDFLWEPIAATYPVRRHPIRVTANEVQLVADHWRRQGQPDYVL